MRSLLLLLLSFFTAFAAEKKKTTDQLILTFEGDGFANWTIDGDAFGLGPATDLPAEINGAISGFSEESFGCSAVGGVSATGSLTSPELSLKNSYVSFRLGGSKEGVGGAVPNF